MWKCCRATVWATAVLLLPLCMLSAQQQLQTYISSCLRWALLKVGFGLVEHCAKDTAMLQAFRVAVTV